MKTLALTLLLLTAAGSAQAATQTVVRPTAPHMATLAVSLAPTIPCSFSLAYQGGAVVITGPSCSWDTNAAQTSVLAAPDDTTIVASKFEKAKVIGLTPCLLRSIAEVLLDEVNTIRANIAASSLAPRTLTQMNTAIDAKIDALGCQ